MLVASGRLTLISGWRLQNDKNQSSQAICVFCEKGCWSLFCSAMRRTSLGVSPNSSLCISFMCFTSISSKSGLRTGHRPGRGLRTFPVKSVKCWFGFPNSTDASPGVFALHCKAMSGCHWQLCKNQSLQVQQHSSPSLTGSLHVCWSAFHLPAAYHGAQTEDSLSVSQSVTMTRNDQMQNLVCNFWLNGSAWQCYVVEDTCTCTASSVQLETCTLLADSLLSNQHCNDFHGWTLQQHFL